MAGLGKRNVAGSAAMLSVGLCAVFALLVLSSSAHAAAKSSSKVAYVTDFGSGSNDTNGPGAGSSIWVNALTGSAPNGTYTTADNAATVSITDVPVSAIDANGAAALSGFDTAIVYEVCDIGAHPATVAAINTFLTNGGKVMLFDADDCAPGDGGLADYSAFLFPFTTSSPGPRGASGSYTNVVASTLTTGLAVGPQPGDSVGDANIFTSFSGQYCASITATNTLGANGFVEAFARTAVGGLAVYEGEDFWFTFGPTPHLRLVFDDVLEQKWAPDGLGCAVPASGIGLTPPAQTLGLGAPATVTAKVVDINGNPVANVNVKFSVVSGPTASPSSGTGTTDSAGQATFTFTSANAGTDSVVASFVDNTGTTHTSNTATVIFAGPSFCSATLTASDAAHTITGNVPHALNLTAGTWVISNATWPGRSTCRPAPR